MVGRFINTDKMRRPVEQQIQQRLFFIEFFGYHLDEIQAGHARLLNNSNYYRKISEMGIPP